MTWTPERSSTQGDVEYNGSLPWDGGSHCTGGLTPGARELGQYLQSRFPFIYEVGGYNCRENTAVTSSTSTHGLGRAIDLMIRQMPDGTADRRGDEVAQWLIDHAHEIGVQLIIWDKTIWNGGRRPATVRPYTGPRSHEDHLHVEINNDAANRRMPWFQRSPEDVAGSTSSLVAGGGLSPVATAVIAATVTTAAVVAIYYGAKRLSERGFA